MPAELLNGGVAIHSATVEAVLAQVELLLPVPHAPGSTVTNATGGVLDALDAAAAPGCEACPPRTP